MSLPAYEYLSHPADVRFRAFGNTLEEVFEYSAIAMFNVIVTDINKIKPERSMDIEMESNGLENLLYDYLSELLYQFEVEEIIFGEFHVDSIIQTNTGYILKGRAMGEDIDLTRHAFETEVKAVTYHQLSVTKEDVGYSTHVIVDT
jgi:SHS2 domain-containing protein